MGYKENLQFRPNPEGIKPFPAYRIWEKEPLDNLSGRDWRVNAVEMLEWGLMGPTSHNKQSFEAILNPVDKIMLIIPTIPDRREPSDLYLRERHIGTGCVAENTATGLRGYGLEPEYEIVSRTDPDHSTLITGVRFDLSAIDSGKLTQPELFELMKKRRSYRGEFNSDNIPSYVVDEMYATVDASNIDLQFITSRLAKMELATLQFAADQAVLFLENFRKELAESFAPYDTQKTRVMPADTFNLSPKATDELLEALESEGRFPGKFTTGFATADLKAIKSAPAVGVISVSEDMPQQWVEAGMTFERIWLIAEKHNLNLGVMAAMVESDFHNERLKKHLNFEEGMRPTVVFRFGKGKSVDKFPHSPRDDIHSFIVDEYTI